MLFIRWCFLILLLGSGSATAQVQQGGTVTPGHAVQWITNGIIGDAGTAASGTLTSLGVTNNGGPGVCVNSAPITTDYNSICLQTTTSGGGQIAVDNHGSATGGLSFVVNGVTVPIGSTTVTVGTTVVAGGTNGYFLYNNAGVLGNFNLFGTANTWTQAQAFSSSVTVPTRTVGDNTTNAASTAFVQAALSIGALTVGTTPVNSGTSSGLLYNNASVLGNLATGNNGVLITSAGGVPSISSTLPSGLAIPSPTFSGTVSGANTVPLTILAQSGANTMLGNWTGSTANVTANNMPACADSGGLHLNYVSGTGITCGTSIGAAAAGSLTGATLAANVVTSSLTSVGTLTGGTTGVGFTVALSNSTITGTLPTSVLPAFTGNVTSSAGSAALTIGTSQVTNAMLAGLIDLTTKMTGALPIANGGTAATSAATALTNLGAVPLAGGTMSGLLVLSADPSAALGAATKQYVDSLVTGLQVKASVATATTANITLSGEQTIDGVLTSASRVLVKNQSTTANNGIYVSAAGAWTRATDLDVWSEAVGAYTLVTAGTAQANTGWTTQVAAGGTIGVTSMPWAQFSAQTAYIAGAGLTLTGSTFSIGAGQVTNAMLAGSIAASKLVGSDIATVGTIATGTWHGTAVGTQYGGTGQDWSASSGVALLTAGTASLLSTTGTGAVVRAATPSIADLTVTSTFSASGLVTNVDLVNSTFVLGGSTFTLGATATTLTMLNNQVIGWKNTGGATINALYLDTNNVFQLGGGDNVAISATQASSSSSTGALQVAGGVYAGAQSLFAAAVGIGAAPISGNLTLTTAGQSSLFMRDTTGVATHKVGKIIYDGGSSVTGGAWVFQKADDSGNFVANLVTIIQNTGNVGFGTTSPIKPVHVVATSAYTGIAVGKDNSVDLLTIGYDVTNKVGTISSFAAGVGSTLAINPLGGNVGIVTATPGTLGTGQGIAIGANTSGQGTIFVTPYVDANLTTSTLAVQVVDQAAASTNGGTGYEYAVVGGIKSTHNDGSLAPNKVAMAGMATMSGATSGNGWGGYFLCGLESGSRAGSICVGAEIDTINSTSTDRNYSNLGTPSYGLQLTGTSNKTNTAALLISGAAASPQWYAGIVFNNSRSTTQDYGIDFAFDASNTFGQSAIRLPNNQTIAWKRAGGSNLNGMYLDGSDIFQLGGGLPVAMTGLGAVAQTNVICFNSGTGLLTYQTWATGCAVSSVRFKQDIVAISPDQAFSIANQLLAVQYHYRPEADLGSDMHMGFTAEQVEQVNPALVTYDAAGRPNAVKYQELAPILAGAIQYLKAANDNLESRLTQLEKQVRASR